MKEIEEGEEVVGDMAVVVEVVAADTGEVVADMEVVVVGMEVVEAAVDMEVVAVVMVEGVLV